MCRSQKHKKASQLKQPFALWGSAGIKAACKNIDEIDHRGQFHQHFMISFYALGLRKTAFAPPDLCSFLARGIQCRDQDFRVNSISTCCWSKSWATENLFTQKVPVNVLVKLTSDDFGSFPRDKLIYKLFYFFLVRVSSLILKTKNAFFKLKKKICKII